MLTYDPDLRISARKALKHPFFKPLRDADIKKQNEVYVMTGLGTQFSGSPQDNPNTSKNLDDTTVTDQNNLSDYAGVSQRNHNPAYYDISKFPVCKPNKRK